jgi:hypothetical protein
MSLPSGITELSPNASAEAAVETLGFASKTTTFETIANTLPPLDHYSEPPNNWGQETERKSAEFQLSARQNLSVFEESSSNESTSEGDKATVAKVLNSSELRLPARHPPSVFDETTSSNESNNTATSDDHTAAVAFLLSTQDPKTDSGSEERQEGIVHPEKKVEDRTVEVYSEDNESSDSKTTRPSTEKSMSLSGRKHDRDDSSDDELDDDRFTNKKQKEQSPPSGAKEAAATKPSYLETKPSPRDENLDARSLKKPPTNQTTKPKTAPNKTAKSGPKVVKQSLKEQLERKIRTSSKSPNKKDMPDSKRPAYIYFNPKERIIELHKPGSNIFHGDPDGTFIELFHFENLDAYIKTSGEGFECGFVGTNIWMDILQSCCIARPKERLKFPLQLELYLDQMDWFKSPTVHGGLSNVEYIKQVNETGPGEGHVLHLPTAMHLEKLEPMSTLLKLFSIQNTRFCTKNLTEQQRIYELLKAIDEDALLKIFEYSKKRDDADFLDEFSLDRVSYTNGMHQYIFANVFLLFSFFASC